MLFGGEKSESFPEKSANDDKCRAKGAECRKCKKIGHYAKCCRSSGAEKEERKVKAVQQTCQDIDEYHDEYVYSASKEGELDVTIDVEINGKPVEMIIDTGFARTLLPKRWFRDNIDSPLKQSNAKFSAFGGTELSCLGTFEANVKCKNQEIVKPVFVIDVDGPPLLRMSAIHALNLVKIYAVVNGRANERECIFQEYADVFKEELGVFKNYRYDIKVNKEVPPIVQTQRPVPAPLESRIKEGIERMICEDVKKQLELREYHQCTLFTREVVS